ncbi:hypothetical protein QFC19_004741 [Naganishia cerealis]|uniref:Uncharacterized protein n=1 Tax=Naganishia cerealis TaxID=610337 RepID=A0ACC2VW21_9TREE|nr:hypothetical protein QFC19_004741 [Naganishia cerealis]
MLPPLREPYFEPVTASGQPVLLEAAEKRLKIIEAEGAKKRTSTRALALPFGMPYSRMIEWNFQYDLDGDFWKPYREARLNGSFTLESVKAAEASGQNPLPIDTREDISSALAVQLPPSENDDGPPPSLLVQRGNNNILPPPPPISPPPPREPDHFSIAPDIKQRIMEQCMKEQGKRDIGPNSEREDPDIVPSSWNTEDAVASSGG